MFCGSREGRIEGGSGDGEGRMEMGQWRQREENGKGVSRDGEERMERGQWRQRLETNA